MCRRLGVKVVLKLHGTLCRALMRVKNARPDLKMKEVVHEVPCKECECSLVKPGRTYEST